MSVVMDSWIDNYVGEWEDATGNRLSIVELWEEGTGFTLDLNYEGDYPLRETSIEALTVGLSRHTEDTFLDEYYRLLGPLEYFGRIEAEQGAAADARKDAGG